MALRRDGVLTGRLVEVEHADGEPVAAAITPASWRSVPSAALRRRRCRRQLAIVDALGLLGDPARHTWPYGGNTLLVAARLAAPALVGHVLVEDTPPYVRHARHDLCHGHGGAPPKGVRQCRAIMDCYAGLWVCGVGNRRYFILSDQSSLLPCLRSSALRGGWPTRLD